MSANIPLLLLIPIMPQPVPLAANLRIKSPYVVIDDPGRLMQEFLVKKSSGKVGLAAGRGGR